MQLLRLIKLEPEIKNQKDRTREEGNPDNYFKLNCQSNYLRLSAKCHRNNKFTYSVLFSFNPSQFCWERRQNDTSLRSNNTIQIGFRRLRIYVLFVKGDIVYKRRQVVFLEFIPDVYISRICLLVHPIRTYCDNIVFQHKQNR